MDSKPILTEYISRAMQEAEYEEFDDGTFGATIPSCLGVVAFGDTLKDCADELRSTLEDWMLAGFKLGHPLPTVGGINLEIEPNQA